MYYTKQIFKLAANFEKLNKISSEDSDLPVDSEHVSETKVWKNIRVADISFKTYSIDNNKTINEALLDGNAGKALAKNKANEEVKRLASSDYEIVVFRNEKGKTFHVIGFNEFDSFTNGLDQSATGCKR